MALIPTVIEKGKDGREAYDIYSRMLKDRVVMLGTEVTSDSANSIIAQLLFLEAQDPTADIQFYINSPGGCVHSGLAIYDTINFIKCDVSTICLGMAASMGAFLLSSGAKGKRFALPNAQIMVHQVSSGTRGHVEDQRRSLEHSLKLNGILFDIMSKNTGMPLDELMKAADRDNWMGAEQARHFGTLGLIDKVINKR